jgi:hypothetical protein
MDSKILDTKEGAAITADLSQHEPHVEVVDLKSLLLLQMRRDWLNMSQRSDCKPRDSLERSGRRSSQDMPL